MENLINEIEDMARQVAVFQETRKNLSPDNPFHISSTAAIATTNDAYPVSTLDKFNLLPDGKKLNELFIKLLQIEDRFYHYINRPDFDRSNQQNIYYIKDHLSAILDALRAQNNSIRNLQDEITSIKTGTITNL
jgi:hypothetical protein